MGFRFGPVGYSSDAVNLPEDAFRILEGIDVWIVGAFTDRPHPTHAHVDKALEWIDRIKPRYAVLTHMSGRLDYGSLLARLPKGVEPAYDGLVIEAREEREGTPGRAIGSNLAVT
jgi:phosphoribosyl 1,2-cyclic phosphate phosphodiesterase